MSSRRSQLWQLWNRWARSIGKGILAVYIASMDSCDTFQQGEFRCDEAAARLQHCCAPSSVDAARIILNCSIQGCSNLSAISLNEASSTCIRDSSCAALVQAGACQITDWTGFDNACSTPAAACSYDGGRADSDVDGGADTCLVRLQALCQVRGQLSCQ